MPLNYKTNSNQTNASQIYLSIYRSIFHIQKQVFLSIYLSIYEVHTISFQTFFVWALLLIVNTWNSTPLWSNLLRLQFTCCTVPTISGRPHGISSWTPLKPQHSNPNPNPLANKLWCTDFLIPQKLPLKNWCSIHARCSKSSLKHPICFCGIFFQV